MRTHCILILLAACGDDATSTPDAASGAYTLETCTTTIGADVPEPYSRFTCVDVSVVGSDIRIVTRGLPPHLTYYYGAASPNYVAWDSRGGAYNPNPNSLVESRATFVIPITPSPSNATISVATVDGVNNTNGNEYRGGPAGVALDSVLLFNPLAAPGDDIEDEQFTFDTYNAHPAPGGQYHYHRDSPGPYETGTEAYGVMCDGTWVLGCNELDGTAANESDLDAQNGHVHAITGLGDRYHVHICPSSTAHPRPYTPEIQFYDRCTVQ